MYKTTLLCLLALLPMSFSTLQARRDDNYRRRSVDRFDGRRHEFDEASASILQGLPSKHMRRFQTMSRRDQKRIAQIYFENKKDLVTPYLLLPFGFHCFYLGSAASYVMSLLFILQNLVALIYYGYLIGQGEGDCTIAIGYFTKTVTEWFFNALVGYVIVVGIEMYRIPGLVEACNEDLFEELLNERGYN